MRVWEFGEDMRFRCLHDQVTIKRGDKQIVKCSVEDLPHREIPNRHPMFSWADEHIKNIHMKAKISPETAYGYMGYVITLELFEKEET